MCMYYMFARRRRPEGGVRSPGMGVAGSYKLPSGCLELNKGPLEEQSENLQSCYLQIFYLSLCDFSPSPNMIIVPTG